VAHDTRRCGRAGALRAAHYYAGVFRSAACAGQAHWFFAFSGLSRNRHSSDHRRTPGAAVWAWRRLVGPAHSSARFGAVESSLRASDGERAHHDCRRGATARVAFSRVRIDRGGRFPLPGHGVRRFVTGTPARGSYPIPGRCIPVRDRCGDRVRISVRVRYSGCEPRIVWNRQPIGNGVDFRWRGRPRVDNRGSRNTCISILDTAHPDGSRLYIGCSVHCPVHFRVST